MEPEPAASSRQSARRGAAAGCREGECSGGGGRGARARSSGRHRWAPPGRAGPGLLT